MDRKKGLLAAIDLGRKLGEDLASRLSDSSKAARGTFERWSAKDVFAHCAEWLTRDVSRLKSAVAQLPAFGADGIDPENQAIFEKYSGMSWDEVYAFYMNTFREARTLAETMSTEDLETEREFTDGSTRAPWRMIASHALMHLSQHLALVYDRENMRAQSSELEETTARVLKAVDDSPEWIGTTSYNLACHYALIGNAEKAIELLREGLLKNPALIDWSRKDTDFDGIRDTPGFDSAYPS